MEDWPLARLCEWNCQLCMCTVVVRMCNCQILTGANIYMVSYPFKIFTSIWLTHCFCNSILFSCFCFDYCSRILSPSVPFRTNPAISPIIRINKEWIGGESSITVYIPNTKWPVLKPKHWVFICNFSLGEYLVLHNWTPLNTPKESKVYNTKQNMECLYSPTVLWAENNHCMLVFLWTCITSNLWHQVCEIPRAMYCAWIELNVRFISLSHVRYQMSQLTTVQYSCSYM